ncbi:MAG: adenylosuccinate synthase [Candidatus Gracilibacteria bacterium]|nr:adenylosuccinate synthase [Candidatus Gracilibacteria bacterium]
MHKLLTDLGSNVAIIGTQWGDEGKGKLVDAISGNFDVVCRFSGGANAGHTIVVDGTQFIFHLLPSGMLHPQTIGVVGNGTVVELPALMKEIEDLNKSGLTDVGNRIKISLRAHILMGYHKKIDAELERRKGDQKIGTTGRGIGPAYTDKISRMGIRCEDLLDRDLLKEKIERNCAFHGKNLGISLDPQEEIEALESVREQVKPLLCDSRKFLYDQMQAGKKILFEGAQGHQLDVDHGTYPFVTSSPVSTGGICTGLGVPPQKITGVIGIAKAYCTRVGSGPFPSELDNELGEQIRKQGAEFGATTGRPRRCGWFDAVATRTSLQTAGVDAINLTKLDVLSGLKELKVVTKYTLDGRELFVVPTTRKANEKLEKEMQTFPGWDEPLSGIHRFEDLPENAKQYVLALEKLVGVPIRAIGTGPDRNDLLFRE